MGDNKLPLLYEDSEFNCRICTDIIENPVMYCDCKENLLYHKECFEKWLIEKKSNECEICNQNINVITRYDKLFIFKYIIFIFFLILVYILLEIYILYNLKDNYENNIMNIFFFNFVGIFIFIRISFHVFIYYQKKYITICE